MIKMLKVEYKTNEEGQLRAWVTTIIDGQCKQVEMAPEEVVEDPSFRDALAVMPDLPWLLSNEVQELEEPGNETEEGQPE